MVGLLDMLPSLWSLLVVQVNEQIAHVYIWMRKYRTPGKNVRGTKHFKLNLRHFWRGIRLTWIWIWVSDFWYGWMFRCDWYLWDLIIYWKYSKPPMKLAGVISRGIGGSLRLLQTRQPTTHILTRRSRQDSYESFQPQAWSSHPAEPRWYLLLSDHNLKGYFVKGVVAAISLYLVPGVKWELEPLKLAIYST